MKHLPVGTRIVSIQGECDEGVMSSDDTNTPVERSTGPNAVGTIFRVDARKTCLIYHVEFQPSEVWVALQPDELADPAKYTVL
jgi:hypothetical protein